jgi:hypothetical protein
MILEDVYALLSGDAAISAITSGIYPVLIPESAAYPAIAYQRTNSSRAINFDEVENFVATTIQVDSYAETYNTAVYLSDAVKAALNNYAGGDIQLTKLDTELDVFEDASSLFRVSQRYMIWHTET